MQQKIVVLQECLLFLTQLNNVKETPYAESQQGRTLEDTEINTLERNTGPVP